MSTAIRIENLTLSYERHPAVHHVSGRFESGSLTAITGPNGAGKSTLLKGIAGILRPSDGRIIFETDSKKRIAYLPQAADLQRDFPITVMQMVSSGLWERVGCFGGINQEHRQRVQKALDVTGLKGFEDRQVATLSAGQFQRALFARMMLQDADVLLLDEPFTAVDDGTANQLLELVLRWHKEGRTIICVLHDFTQISKYFPQCLLLARECLAWGKTEDTLRKEVMLSSRTFREAWASQAEVCAQ